MQHLRLLSSPLHVGHHLRVDLARQGTEIAVAIKLGVVIVLEVRTGSSRRKKKENRLSSRTCNNRRSSESKELCVCNYGTAIFGCAQLWNCHFRACANYVENNNSSLKLHSRHGGRHRRSAVVPSARLRLPCSPRLPPSTPTARRGVPRRRAGGSSRGSCGSPPTGRARRTWLA